MKLFAIALAAACKYPARITNKPRDRRRLKSIVRCNTLRAAANRYAVEQEALRREFESALPPQTA